MLYLWRALANEVLHRADARKRETPINKPAATWPIINEQYDTAISQRQRINQESEMDKPMDLARRLTRAGK
jgi:hypothetical protein